MPMNSKVLDVGIALISQPIGAVCHLVVSVADHRSVIKVGSPGSAFILQMLWMLRIWVNIRFVFVRHLDAVHMGGYRGAEDVVGTKKNRIGRFGEFHIIGGTLYCAHYSRMHRYMHQASDCMQMGCSSVSASVASLSRSEVCQNLAVWI